MARKRFRRARAFFARTGGRARRAIGGGGVMGDVVGAAGYGLIGENLADQLVGRIGIGLPSGLMKAFAGYLLAKNTSGVLRNVGRAAVMVEAYRYSKSGFSGIFGNTAQVTTTTTNGATF